MRQTNQLLTSVNRALTVLRRAINTGTAGRSLLALMPLVLSLNACTAGKPADVLPKAMGVADETSAIQSLRTIATAETQLKATSGNYGSFDELVQAGFLDERFAGSLPNVRGYAFAMTLSDSEYRVNADPQTSAEQPTTGSRHFFLSSADNVIHVTVGRAASTSDPAI